MVDTLPTGVTFVSATGSGWSCINAGNVSVTCTRATYATGASSSIAIVVTAPAQAGTLVNSATVSASTPDPVLSNNADDVTTTVGPNADLSLVKTGTATVTAAGAITYTLLATNLGPSDADDVSVLDTLPPGVTFVSATGTGWLCSNSGNVSVTCDQSVLAAGVTAELITVVVTAPADGGPITNSATVSATTPDPDLTNNTDTAATTVTGSADLSLLKSGPASVAPGGMITYILTVTNAGPSAAADVVVTDTLPAGVSFDSASGIGWSCTNSGNVSVTCTRATLATGAAAPITVVVRAPVQAASLANLAAVTSSTTDPDPDDNDDSVTTTVGAAADLSLVKTGPATVQVGESVTYVLAVRNAGPDDAVDVSVTDTLPAGVTFVSASGTGWTCTNDANASVTCVRPGLADGASAPDIDVVVRAPAIAGTLTNNAGVSAATFDPVDDNNASLASTGVLGQSTGGGTMPGTGGHGFGVLWLSLLLIALGAALRSVRRHPDQAL